ncbi:MAG: hypothetical protein RMJ43_09090, partial [Chloroherpetonaceae bacterium]|nr:hypothetical protein [Chthonomonadaceae bacterium]MDW8207977.1 hypothetical protein [Chloroherpetonaceae bacterium]
MNSIWKRLSVMALLAGAIASGASAQVLYDANSWEATGGPPNWVPGSIVPQNGWIGLSADDGSYNPITVATLLGSQTITPATGTQMQRIIGHAQPNRNSYVWVDLGARYANRTPGNNSIWVTSDIFLPGVEASTGVREQGIDSFDFPGTFIAGWTVINRDRAFILDGSGTLSDPGGTYGAIIFDNFLPRDEWIRVEKVLDYDNNLIEAFVNGVQIVFLLNNQLQHGWPLFGGTPRAFNDADLVSYGATGGTTTSLFTDNYRVAAVRSINFSGKVEVQDTSVGQAARRIFVFFELLDENGNSRTGHIPIRSLIPDSGNPDLGTYLVRFHNVPNGNYRLYIKGELHLSRVIPVTVSGSGTVIVPPVTLLGGDANGDDAVDVLDLAELITAFDSSDGDP